MAILKGILKESLEYYRNMEKRLASRIRELPRGSILKRRIGKRSYFYLKYREGRRVASRYLGKARPEALEKAIEERRLLKRQLEEVQENLRMLARLNRGKRIGRPV